MAQTPKTAVDIVFGAMTLGKEGGDSLPPHFIAHTDNIHRR
jgi:hypothetical protein